MGWLNGKPRPAEAPTNIEPPPAAPFEFETQPQAQPTPIRSHTSQTFAPGFHKAIKGGAKARVALIGVAGCGKSWTMLTLARALAGPDGKICCIDTEHGSLSKYAGEVTDFDVDEPESYSTDYLLAQLDYAEQNHYAVFCVDSLSHFWMGKDGALEFVDTVKKRTRDQMEGWKVFKPHEQAMVDRFLASPCHVIVTMRTKTDYEEQVVDGRKKRVKIGLAPVQREGLEYVFDLVCSMDDENNLIIDKTRCSFYSQERMRAVSKPTAKYFEPFIQWLDGPIVPQQPQINLGGNPAGTQAAADFVGQQKIAELTTTGEIMRAFATVREKLGEVSYLDVLKQFGALSVEKLRTKEQARECYKRMLAKLREAA